MNNPLIYTDPSGEFIFTAACLLIPGAQFLLPYAVAADFAAMSNVLLNLGNIDNGWDALKYFGVGAVTGLIGAGVGMGVNASLAGQPFMEGVLLKANVINTGFASGFVSGAAGGFTSGFITGFGNEAIQGGDAFDMLASGWSYGWKGAIGGAVMGGIMGGIDAVRHDRHFITGAMKRDVYIVLNENGDIINIAPAKDVDFTRDHFKEIYNKRYSNTVNDDYPHITVDKSHNQFTTKITIPKHKNLNSPSPYASIELGANVRSIRLQGRTLIITSDNKLNSIGIEGWRWGSRPLTSFRDFFHFRNY